MAAGAHIVVQGVVQGVGYRYFASTRARALGLKGFARNQADGTVEIEVSGPRTAIEELISELRQGPRHAVVSDVSVAWVENPRAYAHFEIR